MITEQETENKSAGKWAWFAERDARIQSVANSSRYTNDQKVRAERLRMALMILINAENIFVEYRKKFISVKVHKPKTLKLNDLWSFEEDWSKEGITKLKTAQGVTYRIPA